MGTFTATKVENILITDKKNILPKYKKREELSFFSSVPLDVLFSNEYLSDLARICELCDVAPDPNNLPWGENF